MAATDVLLGAGLAIGSGFVVDIWREWRIKRANNRREVKDAQTSALLIEAEVEGLHASVQGFLERGWWSHLHTFWWQTRGDRLPVIADLGTLDNITRAYQAYERVVAIERTSERRSYRDDAVDLTEHERAACEGALKAIEAALTRLERLTGERAQ